MTLAPPWHQAQVTLSRADTMMLTQCWHLHTVLGVAWHSVECCLTQCWVLFDTVQCCLTPSTLWHHVKADLLSGNLSPPLSPTPHHHTPQCQVHCHWAGWGALYLCCAVYSVLEIFALFLQLLIRWCQFSVIFRRRYDVHKSDQLVFEQHWKMW